ncbi:MAG: glucose-1-phosphate adenylyltransferase subunit GlgD [Candidatus Alectryocaccobium sp.]|mgnify:CR=1 FL=1|jgi:glucose-1-phosphate adenylyltransferase|nr:glucose-1-phosphate adenylyltransferase subunit GlgD [Candidatus Alectryocaccobium sp.]
MRALGIILAGGNNSMMRELSNRRAIAAMPIVGSFRAIDFALSNMTNSGVNKVAVLPQYNARSLNEHLNSSKWWNFGRKHGGLFVFTPTLTEGNSWWYRGTADAIYQNMDWLKRSHEPYVIIASGDGIYKMDYSKMLEYHIRKSADVTIACTEYAGDPRRFGVLKTNGDGRITSFEEKPMVTNSNLVSMGVYIFRRRLLIELIEQSAFEGRYDIVNDILIRYMNMKRLYGYKVDTYWENISTVDSYYKANMDFLKPEVGTYFLKQAPAIYSKVLDMPPAKYNPGSRVSNSLVSSGSIINGEVRNSVIFRNVFIGKNCIIKDSVILNDVYIGDNSHIENCVVESMGTILPNSFYFGENGVRVVVEKNNRYEL